MLPGRIKRLPEKIDQIQETCPNKNYPGNFGDEVLEKTVKFPASGHQWQEHEHMETIPQEGKFRAGFKQSIACTDEGEKLEPFNNMVFFGKNPYMPLYPP
jgi:hypothetical protein